MDGDQYVAALWVGFAASLVVAACAGALGRGVIRWAVLAGVLVFALAPPLISLDVFSYLSYARLGALHGLNPYDHAPAAIPHDLAAIRVEDYRDASSVYGPLFTLASYPFGLIGVQGGLWGLKALAALSVLAVSALVARIAVVRGVDPALAMALVGLNPVVLVDVIGGAHNDGLMMAALLGGVALVIAGRELAGGASLAAAVAIKSPAVFTAPFALLGSRSRPRRDPGNGGGEGSASGPLRLLLGAALAAVVIAAVAAAAFGTSAADGLSFLSGSQQKVSHHSLPATAARATGLDLDAVRAAFAIAYGAFVIWLLAWTARGGDWVRAAGWAGLGLLCATVYVNPWYLIWALPLAAVSRDRLLVAATLALTAYQLTVGVP